MEEASSLYLGGESIRAEDERITYLSYSRLGLRCRYCGEPVFYKEGLYVKAHFSHFPAIAPDKYEQCLARQRSESNDTASRGPWWDIKNGRGQRLALFQEHFVEIIKSSIQNLEDEFLTEEVGFELEFDELAGKTSAFIQENSQGLNRFIEFFCEDLGGIEIEITSEALDYLTRRSSQPVLKLVLYTLMIEVEERENTVISFGDKDLHLSLCSELIKCVASAPWLRKFQEIEGFSSARKFPKRREAKILRKISSEKEAYILLRGQSIFYFEKNQCLIQNELMLGSLAFHKLTNSKRGGDLKNSNDKPIFRVIVQE